MKKFIIILIILIVTILIFFNIDCYRVKENKAPLFCIENPAGTYQDGGTKEYFGLGYKIIDFNRLDGYNEIKIGTWLMEYEDFYEEFPVDKLK